MAPNCNEGGAAVEELTGAEQFLRADAKFKSSPPEPIRIVWRNVVLYSFLHAAALYGAYLSFGSASWWTLLFNLAVYNLAALGVTAGAHRLWSHKTYTARAPFRVFLALANVLAFQNDVIEWARDHRVHHKWSETSADPHDATRGLFFSHVGWLLCRKHSDVARKGRGIDLSDLYADGVLRWQRRNFYSLALLLCVCLPTILPHLLWGEALATAFFVAIFRYAANLHGTWCVNSIAHAFGDRPYDPTISPTQNAMTSILALGEGWHNYHHSFPQDYRASELPYLFNLTTLVIDFGAAIGQVSNLKTTAAERIQERKEKVSAQLLQRRPSAAA